MLPVLRRTDNRPSDRGKDCRLSKMLWLISKKRKKEERDAMASAAFDSLIKIQVGDGQTV
jgi:hypothetical protein